MPEKRGKYKRTKEILERQRNAQLGRKSWNKGKKMSNDIKEKIREKAIGRKITEETKKKISQSLKHRIFKEEHLKKIFENLPRGNKHPNWKGGITSLTMRIRSSFKNRQWRSDVFTRDDYTCQMCGARNGCGKAVYLEADHYPKMFSEIFQEYKIKTIEQAFACEEFWNINNGRTLCRDCHDKTKSKSWRRFADIATNENVLFKR